MIRYLSIPIMCLIALGCFAAKQPNTIERLLLEYGKPNRPIYQQQCVRPKAFSEIYYVCLYLDYLDNGNASKYLSGIPENKDDLNGLWQANSAFGNIIPPSPLPPIMHEGSFSDIFINVIFQQMLKGNTTAYKKYFYLYYNEGEAYGEGMDDQLDHLITDHPLVVLRDWHTLGPFLQKTALETAVISSQKVDLLKQYRQICMTNKRLNQSSCQGIMGWLMRLPTRDVPPS